MERFKLIVGPSDVALVHDRLLDLFIWFDDAVEAENTELRLQLGRDNPENHKWYDSSYSSRNWRSYEDQRLANLNERAEQARQQARVDGSTVTVTTAVTDNTNTPPMALPVTLTPKEMAWQYVLQEVSSYESGITRDELDGIIAEGYRIVERFLLASEAES